MVHPAEVFPSEVWSHVFSFLSAAEKSSVRASCTHFRRLVDHPSLWRDWTVVLDFPNGSYEAFFWATLRRRKVTSVVLRSSKSKHLREVTSSLPAVTTLVMERCDAENLDCLKGFTSLKSLAIRKTHLVKVPMVPQAQQLTHLSLCHFSFSETYQTISDLFLFKNLTSLVFHEIIRGIRFALIKSILASLPKLKRLSLHVFLPITNTAGDFREVIEPSGSQLTSLELFGSALPENLLPENAMKLMPKLKHFSIFYKDRPLKTPGNEPLSVMSKWLSDLHELSTLVIVKGPPIKKYVASIPATVTDLTLCVSDISLEDMVAVAAQIPNLQRLHLDPWPSHLGVNASQIPKLFPKLKHLKIRHEHIPEKNFLDLHQLQDLEILEILDSRPDLPTLVQRLRILTKYRLRVLTPPHQRDVLACPCVCSVY